MQNCTRRANSLNIQQVCRMSWRLQYDEGNKTERIPEGFLDFSHFHLQLVVKPSVVPMKHMCVKWSSASLLSSTVLKMHMTANRGRSWLETDTFFMLVSTQQSKIPAELSILEGAAPVFRFSLNSSAICLTGVIKSELTSTANAIFLI